MVGQFRPQPEKVGSRRLLRALFCPVPVLFYRALWKTGSAVSQHPSLHRLLLQNFAFLPLHLQGEIHPWGPFLEEALRLAQLRFAGSRHLFFLRTEALPPAWGQATCWTPPSLVPWDTQGLGSGSLLHTVGSPSVPLSMLMAHVQWPSLPHLSCYQRKVFR